MFSYGRKGRAGQGLHKLSELYQRIPTHDTKIITGIRSPRETSNENQITTIHLIIIWW